MFRTYFKLGHPSFYSYFCHFIERKNILCLSSIFYVHSKSIWFHKSNRMAPLSIKVFPSFFTEIVMIQFLFIIRVFFASELKEYHIVSFIYINRWIFHEFVHTNTHKCFELWNMNIIFFIGLSSWMKCDAVSKSKNYMYPFHFVNIEILLISLCFHIM